MNSKKLKKSKWLRNSKDKRVKQLRQQVCKSVINKHKHIYKMINNQLRKAKKVKETKKYNKRMGKI